MISVLNDLSLVTCPTDDAIIEALPLTDDKRADNNLKLGALLIQLYIEYFMFNRDYSDGNPLHPPEPSFSDDETMGPFIIVAGNDYLLEGHESTEYNSKSMTMPMEITFEDLQIIISTIIEKLNVPTVDLIKFANIVYGTIYKQIKSCDEFKSKRDGIIYQFNDSRVFSIYTLKKYMLDFEYQNYDHIIIQHYPHSNLYSLLTFSHIFLLRDNDDIHLFEAISIQISLTLLNANICNSISCGIAKKLFSYIFENATTLGCKKIWAAAWPLIANILMESFGFTQLTKNSDGENIFKWYNTRLPDGKYTNLVEYVIPNQIIDIGIFDIRDWIFKDDEKPYILTFKNLN